MKKWRLFLAVLVVALLLAVAVVLSNQRLKNYLGIRNENILIPVHEEPVLAVFSFKPEFENKLIAHIPHFKINLSKSEKVDLSIPGDIPQPAQIMLTLETWGGSFLHSYYRSPLDELRRGKYDNAIRELCRQLEAMESEVLLRFNPEMEVPGLYYPWLNKRNSYIEAFKHFSGLIRQNAPNVKIVWSPAGYPGAMENYPGEIYLDAASVTLKSKSEMTLDPYYPQDYEEDYDAFRRLHRLRFISHPIYLLGSPHSNNEVINTAFVTQISQTIEKNRDVIYSEANFAKPIEAWPYPRPEPVKIGFYDPNDLLVLEPEVDVEHLFADFGNLADGRFAESFKAVLARNHEVIVTFEPFRHPQKDYDPNVLEAITNGAYDKEIAAFYDILRGTGNRIYLRYAHEMEIPIRRYPWQSQNPVTYIASFRYFMGFPAIFPTNICRVWGPAGDRGSAEWYPGDDMVDYLSMAIYGLPDKNITDPEKQESFATIFNRKLMRMRFLDKPIFITEFGVKGPEDYQSQWLKKAAATIAENSRVVGVNYFNMSDTPKAWGDIKPPDWGISKASFHTFVKALENAETASAEAVP